VVQTKGKYISFMTHFRTNTRSARIVEGKQWKLTHRQPRRVKRANDDWFTEASSRTTFLEENRWEMGQRNPGLSRGM